MTTSTPDFSVRLLGRFRLRNAAGFDVPVSSARMQLLIAALCLSNGARVSRARLRDLLWEDRSEAQARNSLRQLLSSLRKIFESEGPFPFDVTSDSVSIDTSRVHTDLALIRSDTPEPLDPVPHYRDLLDGIELPGAELQTWLATERQRLRTEYIDVLGARMSRYSVEGKNDDESRSAEAILSAEPGNEAAHRVLIKSALSRGDRTGALRRYAACAAYLKSEFGVEPDAATRALLEEIPDRTEESPEAAPDPRSAPATDKPSIIVLPFDAFSSEATDQVFADSLTDNLTTEISRFHDLQVIASRSAFHYRTRSESIPEICHALGVGFALSGSVQRSGERLRIVVQLLDGRDGTIHWTERFDRSMVDLLDVQDEVCQLIAARLATSYGGELRIAWTRSGVLDHNIHSLFAAAIDELDKWTKKGTASGRDLLLEAVGIDPNFAKGHAKIAWTYMVDATEGWSSDIPGDHERAKAAVRRALSADPHEPWAVWAAGGMEIYEGRHEAGLATISRAIDMNPNDADVLLDYGYFLGFAGRVDEGLRISERAIRLHPHHRNWYLLLYQQVLFDARKYREVIETAARLAGSETIVCVMLTAAAYAALNELDAAREVCGTLMQMDPGSSIRKWADPQVLPYTDDTARHHLLDKLRKAGVPETGET